MCHTQLKQTLWLLNQNKTSFKTVIRKEKTIKLVLDLGPIKSSYSSIYFYLSCFPRMIHQSESHFSQDEQDRTRRLSLQKFKSARK